MASRDVLIESEIKSYNQEKIIDIAKNNPDWQVRRVAVEHINDENVLKYIVNTELTSTVAIKAMEKINDEEFLSDICLNHPDAYMRLACINRLSDEFLFSKEKLPYLLERMLFNDSNDVVLKSVCENPNLNNQESLMNAVSNIDDGNIQRILLRKITDENLLANFALNNENPFIRREAIQNPNLTNLDTLSEIIRNDSDELNRIMAIYKISDEESFLEMIFDKSLHHRLPQIAQNTSFSSNDYFLNILNNATDSYSRQVAVNFIEDVEILESIVLNDPNVAIRADAIKNSHFNNQKILDDLIVLEKNPTIILDVVSKIENSELLKNHILNHLEYNEAIVKAISKVDDISFLKDLSTYPNSGIRLEVVKRISQLRDVDTILHDIALTETDEKICLKAISAMKIRNDLIEVAITRQEKNIKVNALEQIKDEKLIYSYLMQSSNQSAEDISLENALKEMALHDKDNDVRKIATSKIMDKEFLDEISVGNFSNSLEAQKRINYLFEDIKRIGHKKTLKKLIQMPDEDISSLAQATLDDLDLWEDRLSEIDELDDVDTLKEIALYDFNYFVRLEAEGKLEKILFHIRLDEIDSHTNQEKLKDIVCDEGFSGEIRHKALMKINDKNFFNRFENNF